MWNAEIAATPMLALTTGARTLASVSPSTSPKRSSVEWKSGSRRSSWIPASAASVLPMPNTSASAAGYPPCTLATTVPRNTPGQ